MSNRNSRLLVEDILESCDKIMQYTSGLSFEEFAADSMTVDAVVRNFEIIGEAANRLPQEFKDAHPQVDWFRIRGFRNRIVHDYFGIDYSIVWQIRESYLPKLMEVLEKLR